MHWWMSSDGDPIRYGDPSWATEPAGEQPPVTPLNRSPRFPDQPGADRGHGRPPIVTPPATIPDLPEGAQLRLRPGEWSHLSGVSRGAYVDVTLIRVRTDLTREIDGTMWVWVLGHAPVCGLPSTEQHQPCLQLMVRVDILIEASRR